MRIARSADDVWAVVGDAARVHEWFAGIAGCTVDGSTRTVTTDSGLAFPEEIVTDDRLQRRFQYRITSPPFRDHLSTIDVLALGDDECVVVYAADTTPAALALVIASAAGSSLEKLRVSMEGAG